MRVILLLALALAGCSTKTETHKLNAVLDTDLRAGSVMLTCRESTSGTCHVLFAADGKTIRASAAAGGTASASGIPDGAQYCLADAPPQDGCRLRPLANGQTIVRNSSTRTR